MSKAHERDAETLPLRSALYIEQSGRETDLNILKRRTKP